MSDNRPTEWQFEAPVKGRIRGLTRDEWAALGVEAFALRCSAGMGVAPVSTGDVFYDESEYAPATWPSGLPAAWPGTMAWKWRRLDADMDERTWRAVARWRYGGPSSTHGSGHTMFRGVWESDYGGVAANAGEWWAPADQDGNPCEWPEVEPQPVVVIPAAEMTPLVLHGHRALNGTWRWRHVGEEWSESDGPNVLWAQDDEDDDEDIEWTPCNRRGDFCELRRVVCVAEDAIVHEAEQAAQRAFDDLRLRVQYWQRKADEAYRDRDAWRRRALRLHDGLEQVIAKAWKGGEQ